MYQECPLQVSLGGTRTEKGNAGWMEISGDAWDDEHDDKEKDEDVVNIYRALTMCQALPHVILTTTPRDE